jgi:hypothetical protein
MPQQIAAVLAGTLAGGIAGWSASYALTKQASGSTARRMVLLLVGCAAGAGMTSRETRHTRCAVDPHYCQQTGYPRRRAAAGYGTACPGPGTRTGMSTSAVDSMLSL